ncbi:MAG: hypothetical protein HYY14_04975 [Candidatus Omnitrophica bacterium]|nr:hypothetical protein [Candidatus Omnitrophota bacterium]
MLYTFVLIFIGSWVWTPLLEGASEANGDQVKVLKGILDEERNGVVKQVLDEHEALYEDGEMSSPLSTVHSPQSTDDGRRTTDEDSDYLRGATLTDRPVFTEEVEAMREALEAPITVNFRNVDLSYVLDFLARSSQINIFVSKAAPLDEKKISIRLRDMPLKSALRYILRKSGLDYRIERNVIWVATPEEFAEEEIETRVYVLRHGSGYMTRFSQAVAGTLGQAGGAGGLGGAAQVEEVTKIKDILEQAVPFPKGSRLVFDERLGAVILANTPSNLAVAEEILYALDIEPVQVLIEARFIEVDVTDLKEFGFDFDLDSPWAFSKTSMGGGDHGNRWQVNSGSGLNFAALSRAATEGLNLSLAGVLTRPQFSVTLNALSESRRAKTLSAPKITTLNHQTATIEVVSEEIYPSRYEVAFAREASEEPAEGDFENVPQEFVTRDVGIMLQVTPHVGADLNTITVTVIPEVSELGSAFSYSGNVTLPRFSTRSVATTVILDDEETVVLGGLLTENEAQTDHREIPILSNIPLIGPLFQRDSNSLRRRSLLVFVTASVVKNQLARSIDK